MGFGMSYFTQFSSASPAKITTYTSGSGNFTPISTNQSFARITIVAGGGGGGVAGGGGGGGGARIIDWVKLTLSSYPYAVGAGGNSGNAGSRTIFGTFAVSGGGAGFAPDGGSGGGAMGFIANTASEGVVNADIRLGGGVGGRGYDNTNGNAAAKAGTVGTSAFAAGNNYNYADTNSGLNLGKHFSSSFNTFFTNNVTPNGSGGGPGGDSYMGIGGAGTANVNSGTGTAGSGYGSGGGGGATGGAGAGGIIIIEEFVQ
jgi:hypothetical protein